MNKRHIFEEPNNPTLIIQQAYIEGSFPDGSYMQMLGMVINRVVAELKSLGVYRVDEYFMGDTGEGMHQYRLFFKGECIGYGYTESGMWAVAYDHHIKQAAESMQAIRSMFDD